MRCFSLAQAWQKLGGGVTFLSRCENESLRARIRTAGFEFVTLAASHPDKLDLAQTLKLAHDIRAGSSTSPWVVLDGYHFDSGYQRQIRAAAHHLLVIDDMAHLNHYHAELLLNQNVGADLNYRCDRDTALLLGTEFSMLRAEFESWQNWQRVIPEVARRILVSFGGSDPHNVTLKVIRALQRSPEPWEARIIVGPANAHYAELQEAVGASPNLQLAHDPSNIPELMAWADLAVSAAGSTSWELAFMALPAVVLSLADNQEGIARGLAEKGAAVNLGWHEDVSEEMLAQAINSMAASPERRRAMSIRAREMVDGRGADRVVAAMLKHSVTLRDVSPDDCKLIWEWANEPAARESSFSPETIPWADHVKWFEAKLNDDECFFYLALDHRGKPIGQVRYDVREREAVVSVSLDPSSRGNGYGKLIITKGSERVFAQTSVAQIHAYVKPDNPASVGAFLKAGYAEQAMATIQGHTARHFVLVPNQAK
jgi:UDP-2,4-diacetamido-2,4,6-trideoxy-beta-L-altropyranose hydrolase